MKTKNFKDVKSGDLYQDLILKVEQALEPEVLLLLYFCNCFTRKAEKEIKQWMLIIKKTLQRKIQLQLLNLNLLVVFWLSDLFSFG